MIICIRGLDQSDPNWGGDAPIAVIGALAPCVFSLSARAPEMQRAPKGPSARSGEASETARRRVGFLGHARRGPAQQVHPRTGLVVGTARTASAEGLLAHDRARRLGVEVEVGGRMPGGALGLRVGGTV